MVKVQGDLRRRRPQPVALQYESGVDTEKYLLSDEPLQISILRKIAHSLLILDLVTLRVLQDLGSQSDLLQYQPLIDKDNVAAKFSDMALTWDDGIDRIKTSWFRREFETMSGDELTKRITEQQKASFHAKGMLVLKTKVQDSSWSGDRQILAETFVFSDDGIEAETNDTRKNDLGRHQFTLLLVVRVAQRLRSAVQEVIQKQYLDSETRKSLGSRLKQLDKYYEDACYTLKIESHPLAYLGSYDTQSKTVSETKPRNTDTLRSAVLLGESYQRRTHFVFAFLVPTICLLSCIPAALAWFRGDSSKGSAADADFYQSLSSAMIQLLGIVTSLWPAIMSLHLNPTVRMITWGMAVAGGILTVVAIPLYTAAPTRWCAMLLFGGSVLQGLLQLQLVLGIYNYKEHQL